MCSTISQSLTSVFFMLSEKIPMLKVFNMPRQLIDQKHINYLPWTHTSVTWFILCMICSMYVVTIQHLNYSRQESKKHILQFIVPTPLWPWNKVNVTKPTIKMLTLSKAITMQSLKDLALTVSEEKATLKFVQTRKYVTFLSWTHAKIKNNGILMIYFMYSTILQTFNLIE